MKLFELWLVNKAKKESHPGDPREPDENTRRHRRLAVLKEVQKYWDESLERQILSVYRLWDADSNDK